MTLIENLSRFLTHAVINLLVDQLSVKSTSKQTANVSLISHVLSSNYQGSSFINPSSLLKEVTLRRRRHLLKPIERVNGIRMWKYHETFTARNLNVLMVCT